MPRRPLRRRRWSVKSCGALLLTSRFLLPASRPLLRCAKCLSGLYALSAVALGSLRGGCVSFCARVRARLRSLCALGGLCLDVVCAPTRGLQLGGSLDDFREHRAGVAAL